ncbi:UDP-forming cellulose synthase catalytic subunit, partial [Leptospira borgpetersenii serovar Hardjo-bovis]|nr:UDP-forming cellulose synthase catalytic subunit [Leptospira borgpetersenii serovar Hardjo-bovis]
MAYASRSDGSIRCKYGPSLWSENAGPARAWPITRPTMVALFNPHKGKFNVTAKGGLVEEEYVDWVISRPYLMLVLINLFGTLVSIWPYFYGPANEMLTVVVSIVWVFYN